MTILCVVMLMGTSLPVAVILFAMTCDTILLGIAMWTGVIPPLFK